MNDKVNMPSYEEEQDALWHALDDCFPMQGELDPMIIDTLPQKIQEIEIKAILNALEINNFNRTKTAYSLGLGRTNLIAKCRKYEIHLPYVA